MTKILRLAVAAALVATVVVVQAASAPVAQAVVTSSAASQVISSAGITLNRCLSANSDRVTITVDRCDNGWPGRMHFTPTGADTIALKVARDPLKCLAVPGSSTAAGTRIVQENCSNAARQWWRVEPAEDHENSAKELTFRYRNVNSGLCLALSSNTTYAVQSSCVSSDADWFVSPIGVSRLHPQHSGKCLDVNNAAGDNVSGALAQHWSCLGINQRNQFFDLRLQALPSRGQLGSPPHVSSWVTPSRYILVAQHSGMCLAHNSDEANGTRVRQRPCGTVPDYWYLYPIDLTAARQIFQVKQSPKTPGTCLDVNNSDGGTQDGARVQIYQCLGGQTNQLWRLAQLIDV